MMMRLVDGFVRFLKDKKRIAPAAIVLAMLITLVQVPPNPVSAHAAADNVYNVKTLYGAVGDGVADDTIPINNAIAAAQAAGGGVVYLPTGKYRVTSTITIPAFVSMEGVNGNSNVADAAVSIVGSLALSPVVQINGSPGSSSASLKKLAITRANGTIPAGVIGLLVGSTDYTVLEDLYIFRHAIGYKITGQLGVKANRVISASATEAYLEVVDTPQATFIDSSFGRNGGELSLTPISQVLIKGAADTITFLRCQFNSTGGTPTNGITFDGFNNPNGIIYITDSHMENVLNGISSSATTSQIQRLLISNSTINLGTSLNFINLHPNTAVTEWQLANNEVTGKLNLTKGGPVSITGNRFAGEFHLALNSATVTGNSFYSGGKVTGHFNNLVFMGNIFDGAGQTLMDLATGNKTIFGNVSSGVVNKNLVNEDYMQLGDGGVPFGIKRYTGTLDASGNGYIAHGIPSAHAAGLIVQAWYKGSSGEMVPLTVSYVDGVNIGVAGGAANKRYRVTIMYSNNLDMW
ncbi:glycosyl hydrolase family 28-related protein [Paenibacillus mendelii]|uniref:Glycosyl hydrolase family 28-related protein n=1 Tax=Paenibacillus mendelii TaxID=206163 RepID=A0ABV6JJ67_9BACL|nr:glycosyl hydrolase family 28-related protein [Paenibacillus mendelii]